MTILGLRKNELRQIIIILTIIILATLINFRFSFRKSRDAQRKADVRNIYDALMRYEHEFGFFPFSSPDGKIMACAGELDDQGFPQFRACEWYQDGLVDIFDSTHPPYLETIPGDPRQGQGKSYLYLSSGNHFQLYASLESQAEAEYDPAIKARSLPCGQYLCNFGRSDGQTPLDKSLQEYENELKEKLEIGN